MSATGTIKRASSEHNQLFDSIGLFKAERNLALLVSHGKNLLDRSISGQTKDALARDFSALAINTPVLRQESLFLIIDIGGSHTKAGLVIWREDAPQWLTLFDIDNDHFNSPTTDSLPISRYISNLTRLINDRLTETSFSPKNLTAVGIIWSNAIACQRFEENHHVAGVAGLVTGISAQKSYRKGEFFINQLHDGFNLSTAVLSSLAKYNIAPKVFIIGNDTIFTLKATPGAHAGMVASTGANATSLDQQGWIYNTEMGGLLNIPQELLSEGDLFLIRERGQKRIALEDLIAGKWLPDLFHGQLCEIAKVNKSVADLLNRTTSAKPILSASDLSKIAAKDFQAGFLELSCNEAKLHSLFLDLVNVMAERAGVLASTMAYLSLPDFYDSQQKLCLSLDSSQARFFPGYFESLCSNLPKLLPSGKKAEVVLQSPQNEITVPMRGLAAALAGELAQLP